jgi:hypothetical protein
LAPRRERGADPHGTRERQCTRDSRPCASYTTRRRPASRPTSPPFAMRSTGPVTRRS